MSAGARDSADARALEAELERVLGEFQRLVVRYPFAAQALFASMVAEGRAYAETDEGRAWVQRLQASELIRRGRVVWEAVTLNALEDDPNVILPSKFIEAFLLAAERTDLESFLGSVLFAARPPQPAAEPTQQPAAEPAPQPATEQERVTEPSGEQAESAPRRG